jgi:hypothetical protein
MRLERFPDAETHLLAAIAAATGDPRLLVFTRPLLAALCEAWEKPEQAQRP